MLKYSVIVAFSRIFLFTHIFPTLIISNAGLGTEAEKVEKLSPLFFSTPRNSLVCWAQRPIPSNRNLHKLLRVIFPEVLMEYFEISCWHDDFMKTLPGTFRLQEWNCDFTWFY